MKRNDISTYCSISDYFISIWWDRTTFGSKEGDEKEMRQGKAPTKKQAILLKNNDLDSKKWLIISDTKEEMMIRNRENNEVMHIKKANK